MNWQQLVDVLENRVPVGSVTTYAQVFLWGHGVANKNRPVGALLRGARTNGHQSLTNCAVGTNGELADLSDGSDQQRRQLLAEDRPFTPDGRVDFGRISPVALD